MFCVKCGADIGNELGTCASCKSTKAAEEKGPVPPECVKASGAEEKQAASNDSDTSQENARSISHGLKTTLLVLGALISALLVAILVIAFNRQGGQLTPLDEARLNSIVKLCEDVSRKERLFLSLNKLPEIMKLMKSFAEAEICDRVKADCAKNVDSTNCRNSYHSLLQMNAMLYYCHLGDDIPLCEKFTAKCVSPDPMSDECKTLVYNAR